VSRDELKTLLKLKANSERMTELRDNVEKIQTLSISNAEKYEKEINRLDSQFIKKTSDLDGHFQGLNARLR
jgi:hypothetical protein